MNKKSLNVTIASVPLTHADKIYYPDSRITKLDIARYYEKIAPLILPYLKDRPVSLVRTPEGVDEFRFYQKHPAENFPDYIERVKIKEKEKVGVYITIDALNDLIFLINLGVLEFHTWQSKIDNLEHVDTVIFDLDPDVRAPHVYLTEGAIHLRKMLNEGGITSFVKTSGGKGYHVMFGIETKYSWDEVKSFSRQIAEELVNKYPEKFTLEMKKKNRKGKVFVDYLRNTRGATNISAFSTRAWGKAPISVPIEWDEVEKYKPTRFNIHNIFDHLKKRKRDPWQDYFKERNKL